jgi:DNA-binding transcriptional LysR family regulator
MKSVLPHFTDLLAFDAVTRHGTFTRAARDLNVSQPAIGRRVAALEADLGALLFSRDTKPLRLTPAGQKLFDVLRSGLSRLEATVTEIRKQQDGAQLSIAAAAGFLSFWLVPRLAELSASFPKCELRLMTGDQMGEGPQADVHVRFGSGRWPGADAVKIIGEEVFAACSPMFLQGRSAPLDVDTLKQAKLLQLSDGLERWYDWQSWFEAAGTATNLRLNTIDFDSYSLLISAALAGQGIALCWSGLLDHYLSTGALLRVSSETVASARGYYATCRQGTEPESTVGRLMEWLARSGMTN